jgi:hypothetical protein
MNAATIMQSRPCRNSQEHPARQTACAICDENPCRSPSFCRACRDSDARKARSEKPLYVDASLWREPPHDLRALLDRSVSLQRAWAELNRRPRVDAPRATVEAPAYSLIRSARVEGFLIDRLEIAKDGRIIVYAGKQESSPPAATNSADDQPCP